MGLGRKLILMGPVNKEIIQQSDAVYQLNLAKLIFGNSLKNYGWRNFNLAFY